MSRARPTLREQIEKKGFLLADGATGTNLFEMGLQSGESPELWNETQPEKILSLHRAFTAAGADIILTNTFGGNRNRLALHDAETRVRSLNMRAAELARQAADEESGRPVFIAGSIGPTGDLFAPLGPLTPQEAIDSFGEQMTALKEGGVDLLWIETMSAEEEIEAAAEAAQATGLEYVFTASFDTAGRTMMGITPSRLLDLARSFAKSPLAVGANCGVGATDLLFSLLDMSEAANPSEGAESKASIALIAKANCGIPQISGDRVVYSGTPELMARYVCLAADMGAKIIGGCCGTSPAHLAAMRKALDAHEKGAPPNPESIVAQTGALVNKKAERTRAPRAGRTGRAGRSNRSGS